MDMGMSSTMSMPSMATSMSSMSMGMDMGMSSTAMTGAMATSTMTSMGAMSTGMVMSSTNPMPASDMMMTFFTGTNTALFSPSWMPQTSGQYTATCIFLIVLAIILRALVAVRMSIVSIMDQFAQIRDPELIRKQGHQLRPHWTVQEAVIRASLDVLCAGVSYLLMIAVMTMNVGYFLSILGGIFLGSFVFGQRTGPSASH